MAALNRPKNATYEVHENVTVDTQDNEDHTFCGIMFPVKCKDLLPIDHLVINSVSVRGRLGPITVWVSKNGEEDNDDHNQKNNQKEGGRTRDNQRRHNNGNRRSTRSNSNNNGMMIVEQSTNSVNSNTEHRIPLCPSAWNKVYEKSHPASLHQYKELVLDKPIRLKPGETRVIYIHSTLPGDEAIVYDNSYYGTVAKRLEDDKLAILTGRAHVSTEVFGQEPIWGWGNAWRDRREFVGRLAYGTVFKLWNPEVQPKFGSRFQDGARTLLMCQRRWESPWSLLPDECVYYILNMCRWDWFNDCSDSMKARRKREKVRTKLALAAAAAAAAAEEEHQKQEQADMDDEEEDRKPCAVGHSSCGRVSRSQAYVSGKSTGLEDEDEDDDDQMDEDFQDAHDDDDVEDEEIEDQHDVDDADSEEWSEGGGDDDDEEDQYHTANRQEFSFHDVDSDEEDAEASSLQESTANARRDWLRRQFARIHVLRALASMEDRAVAHAN